MTTKKPKENRDRRIARAMLTWLTHRNPGSNPMPVRISFSNHEQEAEDMQDICDMAGWDTKNFSYQQRVLQAVARRLHDCRVVDRWILGNGELTCREEARWQYTYALSGKWLKRLSPEDWAHIQYNVEPWSTPENELERVLDRAFPSNEKSL